MPCALASTWELKFQAQLGRKNPGGTVPPPKHDTTNKANNAAAINNPWTRRRKHSGNTWLRLLPAVVANYMLLHHILLRSCFCSCCFCRCSSVLSVCAGAAQKWQVHCRGGTFLHGRVQRLPFETRRKHEEQGWALKIWGVPMATKMPIVLLAWHNTVMRTKCCEHL